MTTLSNMFSVYIVLVMLGIGLYMAFVQSGNLIHVDKMNREGYFARAMGWFYIVVSMIGLVIITL